MECNRDEAKRSKEIAERKFSDKDIKGAKKFALKAQSLYPELDGISQLLAILDVYDAAENKINGESDFYGILGVNPLADEETVRKNYRKLALSLHPDKNKCVGAEGAFKHISEAWKFLSDKEKRSVYDRKMNGRLVRKKVNAHSQNGSSQSQQPTNNGFQRFTKSTAARTPTKTKDNISVNVNVNVNVKPTVTKTGPASVPSSCNEKITVKTFWTICTRCKLQYEFVRMYVNRNLICPTCHGPFHAIEIPPPNTNGSTRVEPGQFLKPTSTAQAAAMVQKVYARVKREREEAQAVAKKEEASRRKKARKEAKLPAKQDVNGSDVEVKKDGSNEKRLINKATTEIKKKLNEWSSEPEPVPNGDPKKHENGSVLVDVPDPDFHDFDLDRTEKCFEQGQVWAAYDDHDEMPRSYAIIRGVISVDPFKMKICWLKKKVNKKPGQTSGFLEAYGEFKTGKQEIVSAPNYFSHKANFEKRGNGNVRVFPRKGDVCALYTIGQSQSQSQTSGLVTNKYEIVEIDEHDKETGTTVTPLVKVAGFKTVFRRHVDPNQTRVVLESEMFRFSHQIPSYLLTGLESPNAPKGCHELDPAAVPLEFLKLSENGKMDGGDEC